MCKFNGTPVVTNEETTLKVLACKTVADAALYLRLNNENFSQVVTGSTHVLAAKTVLNDFLKDPAQFTLAVQTAIVSENRINKTKRELIIIFTQTHVNYNIVGELFPSIQYPR